MAKRDVSRREFVAGTAGALGAFHIVPRHVLGRGYRAPSDTINIACIGVGGMGRNDVRGVEGENLVAFADVDWQAAEDAFRSYPKARRYRDYREMLEKEARNIDAVTVSTPDHSHAPAAMLALKAGKHVYCQKPLARTLGEVKALMAEAARRPKQATQMGNQGHTGDGMRIMREWVEAGVIGTVREVHYWTNRPIWPQGLDRPTQAHNVPPTMDWNLWLGPAPERPYSPAYAPFNWRGWWDFGTGALGDMACHGMDAAFWAFDLGLPTRVTPETSKLYAETAPKTSRVTYEFPARGGRGPITVYWRDGGLWPPRPDGLPDNMSWPPEEIGGQMWVGDTGAILAGMYGDNPRHLDPARDAELKANPLPVKYERSPGVYKEWLAAIRAGTQPKSTFDGHAGPLTRMVLLGCLAVRAGRPLDIDAATVTPTNMKVPDEWLLPTYRRGWTL
ncbi:MAG: Gfo/Idh/MocA family oxidoreductase [Gemmatimonadetes bacterium]|nr:Gfo/Idh/MocA family oxidoreductase [Gemmatimonadota bacterium]